MRHSCYAVTFAAIIAVACASAEGQKPVAHWTYDGDDSPQHWGALDPAFATCQSGREQSPIDIEDAQSATLDPIQFHYQDSSSTILDNGHTIMVKVAPGNSITIGGHVYNLLQFHFHHPGEEEIHSQAAPMVIHLVHADSEGKIAVIAVELKAGDSNAAIQSVWDHVSKQGAVDVSPQSLTINPANLLPDNRSYYTYMGSLTTPPCTEGVTWLVIKSPLPASTDELAFFAERYPMNARPLQPLNGRIIRASQ
ncbi:MAG: carbonic anhydrase family protein [Acidobacteriaceae bacterium]